MEETENKQKTDMRREKIADVCVFVSVCLFLLSPLIQIIREIIAPHEESILLGPIRTYPNTIETIQMIAMSVAIVLWIALAFRTLKKHRAGEKIAPFVPLLIFGALAVWMYVSQTVNGFTEYASLGEPYRNESLYTFIMYVMGYFFLGIILKSDRLRRAAVYALLASNFVIGILVLIDHYAYSFKFFRDSEGTAAIFHQFNHYAYYLIFAILLSAILFAVEGEKLWVRICCAVVFAVDNVILIINNTFGCYLAVIAALIFAAVVFIAVRRNREEILRMTVLLLAFAVITVVMRLAGSGNTKDMSQLIKDVGNIATDSEQAQSAGTGRWALWKHTVEYISEKPVFGWGVDGTTDRLGEEEDTINDRPHNEYLQWAAFFGIPAALLYLAGLCVIMFGMFPRFRKTDAISLASYFAVAGYIASAFFGNTMYYTAPFFFIFLGMTCRDRFYHRQPEEQKAAVQ